MTPTTKALIEEWGARDIPLEAICERYFGIGPRVARERAAAAALPIPAYRANRSQKSPWLIRASDLADLLDQEYQRQRERWTELQGTAA
jgi:hypothetical protein